jgi:hypothetical protein
MVPRRCDGSMFLQWGIMGRVLKVRDEAFNAQVSFVNGE